MPAVVEATPTTPAEETSKAPAEEGTSKTTTAEEIPPEEEKEETVEEKTERAKTLFAEGKRHYLTGSYAQASKCLADSCELHSGVYGDFDSKCADPYFYYGKSLLELARMEPGVFSNALDGVAEEEGDSSADEEMEEGEGDAGKTKEKKEDEQFGDPEKLTEEEKEDLHEMVEDALEENAEALDQGKLPEDTPQESGDEKKEESSEEKETEEAEAEGSAEEETPQEEGETAEEAGVEGEKTEEEGDETAEVSNLQLAWEMLDMARLICEKQEGSEWKEKLAECYSALGDVAIEDERYEKAIEDLNTCITMQKQLFPPTDRRVAETYFQLGRAENLFTKFAEAAISFKAALAIIEGRKASVEADLAKAEDEEAKTKLAKELEDLTALIPDIQAKVGDAEESQKSADERAKEIETTNRDAPQGTTEMGFKGEGDTSEDKETKNIGHLVRKPLKRKPEEEEEDATKKAKTELNGVAENGAEENGHSAENGLTNGHTAPEVEAK